MRIIEHRLKPLQDLQIHRSRLSVECQQGTLGLHVDIAELHGAYQCSVEVGYYAPGTSMGYVRLYEEGNTSIVEQVDSIIRRTLLQLVSVLGGADVMTDRMFITKKGIIWNNIQLLYEPEVGENSHE